MPPKIIAHNAGWLSQFRFAVNVFWSGVCSLGGQSAQKGDHDEK